MDFMITRRENPIIATYSRDDMETARAFAKRVHDEFGNFIRAVVMFGSSVKPERKTAESDIDLLVIVDDVAINLTPEMIQTYRIIIEKLLGELSLKLHITSLRLTSFWEYVRAGDPVAINVLRDGVALIDTGFFDPLQVLLKQGRIRPSAEAIWSYMFRAPTTLHNAKWHMMQAALDCYWAAVDSAHAALMAVGEVPAAPEGVADLLELKFVRTGYLDKRYVLTMKNLYKLSRMIMHRELKEVSGAELSNYMRDAQEFVEVMRKLVERK